MKSLRRYLKYHTSFKGRLNRKAYIVITIKDTLAIFLYTCAFMVCLAFFEESETDKSITNILILVTMGIGVLLYLHYYRCNTTHCHSKKNA